MIAESAASRFLTEHAVFGVQADGIDDTLGMEKMFPVITLYAYDTWEEAVEQAKNNLNKIGKDTASPCTPPIGRRLEYAAPQDGGLPDCMQPDLSTGGGGSFQNGLNPTNTLGCGSWGITPSRKTSPIII